MAKAGQDEFYEYFLGLDARSRAIADRRRGAADGRIDRVLGKSGPIPDEVKRLVRLNHAGILENPYLAHELRAYKTILKALRPSGSTECKQLLATLTEAPADRHKPAILCPIWRQEHLLETATAMTRYVFSEVANELYLVTIIFDFAPDLYAVEDCVARFQRDLRRVVGRFARHRRGLVMVGAIEPDLRSLDQLRGPDLSRAGRELGWAVDDNGGWVVSAHLFLRAPHFDQFHDLLRDAFSSDGWPRIDVRSIGSSSALIQAVWAVVGYAMKFPRSIFAKGSSRGIGKERLNEALAALQPAFTGPTLEAQVSEKFDQMAAVRQWACFMHRMGSAMLYSVENTYAQRWMSQSEMQLFGDGGYEWWVHGWHRIELHRDFGPWKKVDPAFNPLRQFPRPRTRTLRWDEEWIRATMWSDHVCR